MRDTRKLCGFILLLFKVRKRLRPNRLFFLLVLTIEGSDLAKKGVPEKIISPIFQKFGNAMEIMDRVRKNGCKFGVCPPCAEYFSAKGGDKYDWAELQGGDWLMKNIQDAWAVWF